MKERFYELKEWAEELEWDDYATGLVIGLVILLLILCFNLIYRVYYPPKYTVEILNDQLQVIQTYKNVECFEPSCNSFANDQGERFSFPNTRIRAKLEREGK